MNLGYSDFRVMQSTPEFAPVNLSAMLTRLGVSYQAVRHDGLDQFSAVVPISDLDTGTLSFVQQGDQKRLSLIEKAKGGVVLVEQLWGRENLAALTAAAALAVLVDRPRLVVGRILDHLQIEEEVRFYGVHPTAIVDPGARLASGVSIGPFCIVGACEVGEGSRICAYSLLDHRVQLGKRVLVREHCTIGGHSLGFARTEQGSWERIPHVGYAVIEDDVELFPYAMVDRGTLAETRICRGAKLGFYVLASHNTHVGPDAMLTGNVVLCGRSRVGARTWMGAGSVVKQGIHVGSDVMVGLGAVVLEDVPDGSVVAGVPARPLRSAP